MSDRMQPVSIRLRDDSVRELTREDIITAAGQMPENASGDPSVTVQDRSLPALPLIAAALQVDAAELRPAQALAVLREFDFAIGAGGPRPQDAAADGDVGIDEDPPDADDVLRFNQALERELRRLRGHWVAVRSGHVIADDVNLTSLLRSTADASATVLFVPKTGIIGAAQDQR